MKPRRQPSRGGFTLVEILVALAIFSFVLIAIYSTWMMIIRSSRTVGEVTAQIQRERVAVGTIEQALSSARAFAVNLQYYGFVIENGSEPILSFVAKLPKSFPRSGRFGDLDVRRVTFSVENGDLVMRQCPILMEMDEDEKEHPLVLAKYVKSFESDPMDEKKNDWTDEWDQTNQIPAMIRITLTLGSAKQDAFSSSKNQEVITRVIAMPSVAVQPGWQTPRLPGAPGAQPNPIIQPNGQQGIRLQ